MALFGSFETEREVYSDPIYTVYSAKRAGEDKADYALKVFSIQRVGFDPETAMDLAPLLVDIESSRTQCIELQARGAADSKFIAPVLEKGQDERGVWYATYFYPRSINKLIIGKVVLSREALLHVIRSMAQGALDLKRTCGRSHGDILPSNVQISKSEKLREADVVLCDPMPGGEEETVTFELNDLRSIGRILLQLVQQRSIGNEEDFLILPILSSPQWISLFGKDAETWLGLCNRLLDPNLSLEQMTLERLVGELTSLEPKRSLPPKRAMIAAAAAAVLLIAVMLFLLRPRAQVIAITSDPPGATILVDHQAQAQTTPLKIKLKKGNYVIEARQTALRLAGLTNNVIVPGSGSLHFRFAYGSVAIRSEPPGASIRDENGQIGQTPANPTGYEIKIVPAGTEVKYDLALTDHASRTVRGVVTNGQRLVLFETLPLSQDVGTVEVDSTPRGAQVYLKEKLLIASTPDHVDLEQGPYTLRLVYKDWPEKQLVVGVKNRTTLSTNFYFENGLVSVDSEPSGATVWVGTNNYGPTPVPVRRPAGETTFRLELAGFSSTNMVVRVTDKSTPRIRPALVSDNGTFEFTSDPPGAMIMDSKGTELGRTTAARPVTSIKVPGNYSFVAHIDGLTDVTASLSVGKREFKRYPFVFDYGSVAITSDPPGAAIATDGQALRLAPATFMQKPGVKVTYRFSLQDYLSRTNDVTLQSRELNRPLQVKLSPEPVSVSLSSDPPGALFYLADSTVPVSGPNYRLPWGTNLLTARNPLYPALEQVAELVEIHKGEANEKLFKFNYGTVSFETTPPDAGAGIFEAGKLIAHTPTNLYVRPGPVDYQVIYENQTNHVGTNVVRYALHRFSSPFEIKRDYTNTVGMVLVRVKDPLYVGKFEVTQEQFQRVMGKGLEGKPRQPIVNVKWADAEAFCQKLSELDATSEFARKARVEGWTYGLPTQAEWGRFSETDAGQLAEAVFDSRLTEPKEIDFSRKSANRIGLYDLFGNVAEWCIGASKQPITIGGSFYNRRPKQVPTDLMADTQNLSSPVAEGSPNIGFRCVLRPPAR